MKETGKRENSPKGGGNPSDFGGPAAKVDKGKLSKAGSGADWLNGTAYGPKSTGGKVPPRPHHLKGLK
jgi:hypothetical protein